MITVINSTKQSPSWEAFSQSGRSFACFVELVVSLHFPSEQSRLLQIVIYIFILHALIKIQFQLSNYKAKSINRGALQIFPNEFQIKLFPLFYDSSLIKVLQLVS
jgi:hypothetical protein